jgi:aspartate racemase
MLTIGLIGGMTCESSTEYYRIINEATRARLGGIHSAKSIMVSVDFAEIEPLMEEGKWETITKKLIVAAQQVERGGADFLVICTNTMHKLAQSIQDNIQIPILDIIDVTAEEITSSGIDRVGLLGTIFTMEQDFYRDRLSNKHQLKVEIPTVSDRELINQIIMDELSIGIIDQTSKNEYLRVINKLKNQGAGGVILGCTEIPLLVTDKDCSLPLFNTTKIHAERAVDYALEDKLPDFREK